MDKETEGFSEILCELMMECKTWLIEVEGLGNETAYTDSRIDRVLELSKQLKEKQKARGLLVEKE